MPRAAAPPAPARFPLHFSFLLARTPSRLTRQKPRQGQEAKPVEDLTSWPHGRPLSPATSSNDTCGISHPTADQDPNNCGAVGKIRAWLPDCAFPRLFPKAAHLVLAPYLFVLVRAREVILAFTHTRQARSTHSITSQSNFTCFASFIFCSGILVLGW